MEGNSIHTASSDFFAPKPLPQEFKARRRMWASTFRKATQYNPELIRSALGEVCRVLGWSEKIVICESLSDPTIRQAVRRLPEADNKLKITMHHYAGNYSAICQTLGIRQKSRRSIHGLGVRSEGISVALIARLGIRRRNSSSIGGSRRSFIHWPLVYCSPVGLCMVDILAALLPMVYRYGKVKEDVDRVSRLGGAFRNAVQNGLGWIALNEGSLIAIPMPLARFDNRNRLHGENEDAILWHDGFREYWWHGVRVNQKMILAPETLTSEEILKTRNSEVRRVMIERYGLARFIAESRVEIIHEDIDYGGTRQLFRVDLPRSEPMLIVKVKCPSTGSQYLLQVPPTMRTCDEAIAWTFGFEENQYQPLIET